MRLLVATRSAHKIAEIRRILGSASALHLIDLDEAGVPYDPREEELEPYETFEENAASKAEYFHRLTGLPTVADDSGLAVDALGGAPGVRSKRFAPNPAGLVGAARDRANNAHLLGLLAGRPASERTARYVCVAALVGREGGQPVAMLRGEARGVIVPAPRGKGGFGYDPLFLDPGLGRTFGEIPAEQKHARSHRGRAFRALASFLESERGDDGADS